MDHTLTYEVESSRERGLPALALLVGLGILVVLGASMIASQYVGRARGGAGQEPLGVAQAAFVEETGVRLVRVAVTAGGGMVELRYQVVDPDKAVVVHDDDSPPTIVDEATGQSVNRTLHEHSDRELHTAIMYHELILNAGGLVKRGSRVTVVIGDSRLEHVIVQ